MAEAKVQRARCALAIHGAQGSPLTLPLLDAPVLSPSHLLVGELEMPPVPTMGDELALSLPLAGDLEMPLACPVLDVLALHQAR